jgi:tRNA modification GTPase
VEQLGIERSRAALAGADLAIFVRDATAPDAGGDQHMVALTTAKPTIVVWNKCDLISPVAATALAALRPHPRVAASVALSARTGTGIDELAQTVARVLLGSGDVSAPLSGGQLVTNPRHRDALCRAADHLRLVCDGAERGVLADMLTVDLSAAAAALGEITGETLGDDLLATIFSRFCIGK